jgi:hypothetical protein
MANLCCKKSCPSPPFFWFFFVTMALEKIQLDRSSHANVRRETGKPGNAQTELESQKAAEEMDVPPPSRRPVDQTTPTGVGTSPSPPSNVPPPVRDVATVASNRQRSRSRSPPRRSRAARPASGSLANDDDSLSSRRVSKRTLYQPENDQGTTPRTIVSPKNQARSSQPSRARSNVTSHQTPARQNPQPDDENTVLIKQPETRPISQEQLVAEVKVRISRPFVCPAAPLLAILFP